MFDGLYSSVTSTELSYDDFIETYGRIRLNSASSEKRPSLQSESTASSGSFSTVVEASEIVCDGTEYFNTNSVVVQDSQESSEEKEVLQDNTSEEMDKVSQHPIETQRKNSKLTNMASRFARKSFRIVKKKSSREEVNQEQPKTSSRPHTSTKWNKLFKRSQSSSRSIGECKPVSFRSLADSDHTACVTSESASVSRHQRPALTRSISHSPLLTSATNRTQTNIKRRSSYESESKKSENKMDRKMLNLQLGALSKTEDLKSVERPNFLPLSPDTPEPKPSTPEYEVMKKYEDIRQEEELRTVAIVTLLKRRKNSLKIKCDQFGKDLGDGNVHGDEADIVRSRLKHMKRKLKVVNQCINEQTEAMKVNSAKLDLQQSLEIYQLELIREDLNGYTGCNDRFKKYNKLAPKASSCPSCTTLESVDETCIFDDTSSVTSLDHKYNPCGSPSSLCGRRSSSTCGSMAQSPNDSKANFISSDCLNREEILTGRSRSIDCAVTSDCDSGFDNGEVLSRSDDSLDRSLSKSTASIASSSSRGTAPGSLVDSLSPGSHPGQQCFFSSSSSTEHFNNKGKLQKKLSQSSDKSYCEVDTSVLATIEDFEKFAERTKRRLSNNGKLVPLKKGC